ncbi:MAG: hypothetical protein APU95_05160 [Hadesarchaea archaeon YNP_N21]|nr:MAG: hypothetical protein APU95_05160 [Hadesarchaea archaeon YNP_N21]
MVRIALVQFARGREDKRKNIERMLSILGGITDVEIVCPPETWIGPFKIDEKEGSGILSTLCDVAAENNYVLITGGMYLYRGGKIFDACHVISWEGMVVGIVDKIFPSISVGERKFCTPGSPSSIFDAGDVKFGIAICVDAFYPEIVRDLALKGADIVFNPSNIPENRIELWRSLSRTRASENTVFYVFVNNTQTFYPDKRMVLGHSMVVGPGGDVIIEGDEAEAVLKVELDLAKIGLTRKRWPFLNDMRKAKEDKIF